MLIQFQEYLTFENIYLWLNIGVLPFWLIIILIPNSKVTQFFVNSIILPLIFAALYAYIIYQAILLDESWLDLFKLYLSIDNLYTIFATETFLLAFWIHFLSINLFLGSWVASDAIRHNIPKKIILIPLIIIYFTGPLGFCLYWVQRIFYSKKLRLFD